MAIEYENHILWTEAMTNSVSLYGLDNAQTHSIPILIIILIEISWDDTIHNMLNHVYKLCNCFL